MLLSKKDQERILKPYMENPKKYQEAFTKVHDGNTDFESNLFKYWLSAKLLIGFRSNRKNSDRNTSDLS